MVVAGSPYLDKGFPCLWGNVSYVIAHADHRIAVFELFAVSRFGVKPANMTTISLASKMAKCNKVSVDVDSLKICKVKGRKDNVE